MREVYEVLAAGADGAAALSRRAVAGGDAAMSGSKQQQVSELLHEAAETHHRVYRIVDGADDDWASWYADWLIKLSELPSLLGTTPVRSELVYMLVRLDKEYGEAQPAERWEDFYAARLGEHFQPAAAVPQT